MSWEIACRPVLMLFPVAHLLKRPHLNDKDICFCLPEPHPTSRARLVAGPPSRSLRMLRTRLGGGRGLYLA